MLYVCVYLMVLLFFLLIGSSVLMALMDLSILFEWVVFSVNSFMIEFMILIDWISLMYMGLVMVISSMVLLYSVEYMNGDKFINRFFILVILFIVSMLMMIISPSLFSILFGWDLLGLVSYCLVIYYHNYSSYNSGMVTVLSNRVGDVGLLITIGVMVSYGSWNMYLMSMDSIIIYTMMFLASVTKSAQMPFSSWLPMAMAAPTPVSSLVHSSTLVTAGVYLVIRFNSFMMVSGLNFYLLFISILTMIMSGASALYEYDLKKIIALSTLSQLGLMMMVLSMGCSMLGFYHLMTHAIFKSLLFLCAGIIIHVMNNNQDIRCCGGLNEMMPFVSVVFYVSILSMMGSPFLSGFYSKDLIMELLYISSINLFLLFLIVISLSLTVMYSLRLFFYLFFSNSMNFVSVMGLNENKLMNYSMMLLVILSMISGSMLNWLFFFSLEGMFLLVPIKVITMVMLLTGGVIWGVLFCIKIMYFSWLWGFMVSMWNLNYMYMCGNQGLLMIMEKLNLMDLEWVEVIETGMWFKIKLYITNWFYSEFKIYMMIKFYVLIFLIILLVC